MKCFNNFENIIIYGRVFQVTLELLTKQFEYFFENVIHAKNHVFLQKKLKKKKTCDIMLAISN